MTALDHLCAKVIKALNTWYRPLRKFCCGLLLLLWVTTAWALALVPVPKLSGHVTDLTATFSSQQATELETKLAAFEVQKGSQVAVLILPTTQPEDIAQFGIRVADAWKLGRKKVDDGVILIVAKNDRKLRLEVGYGLEGVLPDAIAKRIIAETITPYFKANDFAGGIDAGVNQLIKLIEGEPLPEPSSQSTNRPDGGLFMFILVIGIVAGWLLSAMLGRTAGGTLAALSSGIAAAILLSMSVAIIIAIFVFFFVGVRQTGRGGWSNGGGFGGGFGGGGSSWGGGGGGFGGGGASGSW